MDYNDQNKYDFFISFMQKTEVYKNALEYLELVFDIKDFDPSKIKLMKKGEL